MFFFLFFFIELKYTKQKKNQNQQLSSYGRPEMVRHKKCFSVRINNHFVISKSHKIQDL